MLRPGHFIALIALALLTLGVLMVNSADMKAAPADAPSPVMSPLGILFSRSTAYMVLALGAMALASTLPVRRLAERLCAPDPTGRPPIGRLAMAAGAVLLICALVYVPGLSYEINGARRWLRLPVPGLGDALSVQPSEIAKWACVGLMAWYGAVCAGSMRLFVRGLVPALAAVGAICAFLVLEDLGTSVLIAGVAGLVLLAAGANVWHFLAFVPVGAAGVAGAILTSSYRMKRLLAFADPYADPQGIGYHTIQSLIAIANGGGWGRGLGHGLQKFGYLPEDRTDFIFCVIAEELGLAGAATVCLLFAGLVWCGFFIMRREQHPALRLFTLGVVATIAFQAVINLAVVTGMAPTKGIALPLLSSGGTGWILTSFCLGLVIAIDRTQARRPVSEGGPLTATLTAA
ncbi:MAG: stage V sporulation protein E [Phycisphaerae bacterium]|nr:MAG: stage V sporulation protein E [Phycisphaerae bacterium]